MRSMAGPVGPSLSRLRLSAAPVAALSVGWIAAGGGVLPSRGWLDVLLAAAMVASWHIWLAVCESVPWADLAPVAPGLMPGRTIAQLPFTEPGSAADRLGERLGRFAVWLRSSAWPRYGDAGGLGLFAVCASLAFALAIRQQAVVFTLVIAALGGALVFASVRSPRGGGASALWGLGAITLPLCMGWTLDRELTAAYAGAAVLLGLAYRSPRPALFNALYGALLALMVANQHSLGAFLLAVLWIPRFVLQAAPPSEARSRAAARWFAASVLVAALALG